MKCIIVSYMYLTEPSYAAPVYSYGPHNKM